MIMVIASLRNHVIVYSIYECFAPFLLMSSALPPFPGAPRPLLLESASVHNKHRVATS